MTAAGSSNGTKKNMNSFVRLLKMKFVHYNMLYDLVATLGSVDPLQSETVNKKYFKFVCIIATCPSVLTLIH